MGDGTDRRTDGRTDGRIAALLITPLWAGHNYPTLTPNTNRNPYH